jgi:xanthine/CO dehydrogenase XdhC/CoxF family maturation factor
MDRELVAAICALKGRGEAVALVTVVATRGSTPRKAGAAMLVDRAGRIRGSIGGGCGEAEAKQRALTALDEGVSRLHRLELTNAVAADEGMACGGGMEIFFQVI